MSPRSSSFTTSFNVNGIAKKSSGYPNKPRKNISESKNSCSSTLQHVTRHCELCEKPASLRCSKCQHVYYCDRDHQAKHWKSHKKLCDIISEDPMNTIAIEEIN